MVLCVCVFWSVLLYCGYPVGSVEVQVVAKITEIDFSRSRLTLTAS